jgi:hypothetical protein
LALICVTVMIPRFGKAQDRDERIANLERTFAEAKNSIGALQKTIDSLAVELQTLRQPASATSLPVITVAEIAPYDAGDTAPYDPIETAPARRCGVNAASRVGDSAAQRVGDRAT